MIENCGACDAIAGDVHTIKVVVLGDPLAGKPGLGESHRALAKELAEIRDGLDFLRKSVIGATIPIVVTGVLIAIGQIQGCGG